MDADNKFFGLQERIQELLFEAPFFADLAEGQIVTEKIGNLEFQVDNAILPLGFGIVITTAAGKALESDFGALVTMEDLNVSIISNPTTDTAHPVLDALAAAINAIHGAAVTVPAAPAGRAFDFFAVTGHQRRMDAPANLHVHELHVSAGARLL